MGFGSHLFVCVFSSNQKMPTVEHKLVMGLQFSIFDPMDFNFIILCAPQFFYDFMIIFTISIMIWATSGQFIALIGYLVALIG